MKQTFALTSTYSSDTFGVCSALYELGGMVVMHDASGCNSTYTTHDEPRWYDMDSMIYISALSRNETILGKDEKLMDDVIDAARKFHPKFIAIVGAPVPYMVGTDYKAIATLLEKELHIPAFGFDTNGMRYYTRGVRDALKAVAERFVKSEPRDKGKSVKPRVNILGATPLDMSMNGTVESLKEWLAQNGMEPGACFAMGDTLEDIAKAGEADLDLVVSFGGLGAARVLKNKFGIPYVCGLPFDATWAAEQISEPGKTVIIGEQIYGLSLAEALREEGVRAKVLCPLDRTRDGSLLPKDIEFVPAPEEDDMIREIGAADVVIADPLYGPVCGGTKLIPLPHLAYSGRIYENEIPNLIGKGEYLLLRMRDALNQKTS